MLTFRDVFYAAAEALGRRRQDVRLYSLPVALLRVAAAVAGALGLLWRPAASLAGSLRFVCYSTTHDSGGLPCAPQAVGAAVLCSARGSPGPCCGAA